MSAPGQEYASSLLQSPVESFIVVVFKYCPKQTVDRNKQIVKIPSLISVFKMSGSFKLRPELKPNRITDDEVKNKSSIEFGQTEPLLIANKKMRIYSSASIAANPMLAVRCFRNSIRFTLKAFVIDA